MFFIIIIININIVVIILVLAVYVDRLLLDCVKKKYQFNAESNKIKKAVYLAA